MSLKTSNFVCKVPRTSILTQFLAKCCKKYGTWWKTTKTCRSPRNKQLFVQSTVHYGFDPIFRKMLQKVWHLVKNQQNLSIFSKLTSFCAKYRALGFTQFLKKNVAKSMAFGKKPVKLRDLLQSSNFLCKVPCTTVLTQFLEKCRKKYGILWKATKTCRSPRNKQLFVQSTVH